MKIVEEAVLETFQITFLVFVKLYVDCYLRPVINFP